MLPFNTPDEAVRMVEEFSDYPGVIGYCVTSATESVALAAFQRRFRPERWDGLCDAETCARLRQVRAAFDEARAAVETARRRRFN